MYAGIHPTQVATTQIKEMVEHHSERWADKVRIVGITPMQSAEEAVNFVKEKNWEKFEHFNGHFL